MSPPRGQIARPPETNPDPVTKDQDVRVGQETTETARTLGIGTTPGTDKMIVRLTWYEARDGDRTLGTTGMEGEGIVVGAQTKEAVGVGVEQVEAGDREPLALMQ